jgi:hypothetical protein
MSEQRISGGASPAGSTGDLQTNAGSGAFGAITPGTGIAAALAVAVGTDGAPVVKAGALGTPSSGVGTNLTGTADGLTAGDVTRNHAIYASASPPTVDVGVFTIAKTGVDLKTAATTSCFTVPTGRTFVCLYAIVKVTAVTGGAANTFAFKMQESGASAAMTAQQTSGSATPTTVMYYASNTVATAAPFAVCAAGNSVQIVIGTALSGSTSVTGTVFIIGYYSS